jgi:hypothetical protein
VFEATVKGNINNLHGKFDRKCSQLLARDTAVDDPIGLLFNAYLVVPCHSFKEYICHHHDGWLDGKLTGMTREILMTFATCKCNYLKTRRTWGAKSPYDKNIIAILAALNALKGHLMLDDKHRDVIKGKKARAREKGKGGNKKMKNKKNTGNKAKQKEDKAWKKVPPKTRDKKSKEVGKYTYH